MAEQTTYGYLIDMVEHRYFRAVDEKNMDEVLDCFLMTGSRDYLLRIAVESLDAYECFLKAKLTRLSCVASIESSFALGVTKKTPVLPPISD